MKTSTTTERIARYASYLAGAVLVLVPFHAFLSVWLASALGHYTAVRLWSAAALLVVFVAAAWLLWRYRLCRVSGRDTLWRLIGVYAVVVFALGFFAYLYDRVAAKALAYGLLSDLRYLAFFLVVVVVAEKHAWLRARWTRLILWPALVVACFAVVQYVFLPLDFLRHFGYGPHTIMPYETINNNPNYPRAMSTLRGANPLGAYMVVVLGVLAALWFKTKRKLELGGLGLLVALALLLSFSRSAWLGAFVALLIGLYVSLKTARARRLFWQISLGMVILTGVGFTAFRSDTGLQNAIFHTQDNSKVAVSSNGKRESALKTGAREVVHEPLGRGTGTAGPASVYNSGHPVRLAENYYLQLGQELGWLGLALFIAIQAVVFARLWRLRQDALALGLFASGIGLVVVNLLSHAWADDTLAFVWWGLAGIALSPTFFSKRTDAAA